jgi:hypothetical protein
MKSKAMKFAITLLALTIGGLAASSQAQPQHQPGPQTTVKFKYNTISVPGAVETDAFAINDKNEIAGDYFNAAGQQLALLLKGTKVTSRTCPTGGLSVVYGLNSAGVAVSGCADNGDVREAGLRGGPQTCAPYCLYLLVNLKFDPFGPVCDCPYALPYDINMVRVVVGALTMPGEQTEAWSYSTSNNSLEILSLPGAVAGEPVPQPWYPAFYMGINDAGAIVVNAVDAASGLEHAYLYSGGSYTQIDVALPNALQSFAHGINNNGDIVYTFLDANHNSHGALYLASSGTFAQFDAPNVTGATYAYGINDEVVGEASTKLKIVGDSCPPGSLCGAFEATVTIKP